MRQYTTKLASWLLETRGSDLLRYVRRRVRSDADARDITQEAYLRFIRLAKPDRLNNPEAYLFRIAGNLVSEHQLRARHLAGHRRIEDDAVCLETPFELAVSRDVVARVRAVLEDLPATPRAVIILHLRDGLTCADIGQQLGVSVSMVKKHLSRALAHCRQRLRRPEL